MKPSRTSWVENVYPLVDAGLRRSDCLRIIREHGLPEPKKSSCVFCPYHSDEFWRNLKAHHRSEWDKAVEMDENIRDMSKSAVRGPVFLHRSLVPLQMIDFDRQGRLFGDLEDEECAGACFL
jgi:hypothetical protein